MLVFNIDNKTHQDAHLCIDNYVLVSYLLPENYFSDTKLYKFYKNIIEGTSKPS